MDLSWEDSRQAFADAAHCFVRTTALVDERWEEPGLGEWDVRALVGHTSRALLTVETYLGRAAEVVDISSTADYYRATQAISRGPAVTERGRDAGAALGTDPAGAVAGIADRVLSLLSERDGSELLTTIAGGMRLADYLPTRVFELAVHTADLAVALGLPPEVPPTAAAAAFQLISDLAVTDGVAGELLLAVTGRRPLPPGFSVL
jgi:uncharacterized protein (TIGR03083 family)